MVQEESSILEDNFIFLLQTKSEKLKQLLSRSIDDDSKVHLKEVESSVELQNVDSKEQIITFVVGGDVNDPIQSAQRLHVLNKKANIILLSQSEKNVQALKEAVKYSPFIGTEVYCLAESDEQELQERIQEIVESSRKAIAYGDLMQETNAQLVAKRPSPEPSFSPNFINKLLDVAPVGIAIVGDSSKVLGWNKEATLIFGKSEAQVVGTPLHRLFEGSEKGKLEEFLWQGQRVTYSSDPLILERDTGDKYPQVLSFTAAPFTYSRGSENALILAIKDVSRLKQTQNELQQINTTLEQRVEERTASLLSYQEQLRSLASQLSKAEEQERHRLATELHDNLGQMLAVSKMRVDLLKKQRLPKETAEQVEEVKQGLEDALTYARNLMSDLKPPPSLDKEDVKATIEWVASKMDKHGLEVIVEDDGQKKRATEEIRTTLLQCVREVLFNIIKHADVDKARIRMERVDDQVKIYVIDNGKGFDPKDTKHEADENGGFGLFNISERMDLLGGDVEVNSQPGKGTTVMLVAPLKGADTLKVPSGEEPGQPLSTDDEVEDIKVMLVDDHQMIREGLKKIVDAEEAMMVVAEASNGREAVKLALETSPDIIVMDVNMPEMNGIEATKEITAKLSDVRVVGLSLHDHDEVIESIRKAGATAYLSKSEAFETLCATIRSEASMVKNG